MADTIEQRLRNLSANRCEYCRIPEQAMRLGHVLDHIIARQHGGKSEFENLALCCGRCNQSKGPNIAGIDPQTDRISPLFNPRKDSWAEHFRYEVGMLIGQTAAGRATVSVLAINHPLRVAARQALIESGIIF